MIAEVHKHACGVKKTSHKTRSKPSHPQQEVEGERSPHQDQLHRQADPSVVVVSPQLQLQRKLNDIYLFTLNT